MTFRKYLTLSIFILLITSCFGQDIITVEGKFPVVISAPHGGSKDSPFIKNRKSGVTTKDSYTIELSKDLFTELQKFKIKPSLIYSNRKRTEVDFNRQEKDAYEDSYLKTLWYQYHFDIQRELIKNMWSDSVIIYLDIHGQNHKHGLLEIGFDTRNYTKEQIILGDMFVEAEIKAYPATNMEEPNPYFDGGYCVATYKNYPNVVAIQLEIPLKYRRTDKARKEFAKKTAKIIYEYYAVLQKEKQ